MVEEKAGETEGNRLKCSFGVCTHAHTHTAHISTAAAPHDNGYRNSMQQIKPRVIAQ